MTIKLIKKKSIFYYYLKRTDLNEMECLLFYDEQLNIKKKKTKSHPYLYFQINSLMGFQ